MLYRILTEDINRDRVEEIVSRHFPGYTIFKAEGFWKLIKENTLVIEITDPNITREKIDQVAAEIRDANAQETVLVQEIQNDSWLV